MRQLDDIRGNAREGAYLNEWGMAKVEDAKVHFAWPRNETFEIDSRLLRTLYQVTILKYFDEELSKTDSLAYRLYSRNCICVLYLMSSWPTDLVALKCGSVDKSRAVHAVEK